MSKWRAVAGMVGVALSACGGAPQVGSNVDRAANGSAPAVEASGAGAVQQNTRPDECAQLMPARLPPPIQVVYGGPSSDLACGLIFADASGHAVFISTNGPMPHLLFITANDGGAAVTGFTSFSDEQPAPNFYPRQNGFIVDGDYCGPPGYGCGHYLRILSGTGHDTADLDLPVGTQTTPGPGRSMLIVEAPPMARGLWLHKVDASGKRVGKPFEVFDRPGRVLSTGVAASGGYIVLFEAGGKRFGRWFSADDEALTAPFEVKLGNASGSLTWIRMTRGRLVLQVGGSRFAGMFREGQAGQFTVPRWMEAYARSRIVAVQRSTGFVAYPGVACAGLEVVAANGHSCGCLDVPNLTSGGDLALDGSVIVPVATQPYTQPCEAEWYWPMFK